jgi:hypothetical protein
MTRQCTCGGIIRQHELTGEREAWTCNACGKYSAISRAVWTPADLAAAKERADSYADWFLTNAEDMQRQSEAVQVVGDKLARQ